MIPITLVREQGESRHANFFQKKTIILDLAGILLAAGLLAGYANREYIDEFPIGCALKAKTICATVFVTGRDAAVVEREDTGFSSLLRLFHARINAEDKSVTCSLLLTGIYEKKRCTSTGWAPCSCPEATSARSGDGSPLHPPQSLQTPGPFPGPGATNSPTDRSRQGWTG